MSDKLSGKIELTIISTISEIKQLLNLATNFIVQSEDITYADIEITREDDDS